MRRNAFPIHSNEKREMEISFLIFLNVSLIFFPGKSQQYNFNRKTWKNVGYCFLPNILLCHMIQSSLVKRSKTIQ